MISIFPPQVIILMLINCNLLNLKGMVPPRHRVKKIIVLYNDFFMA